MPGIVGPPDGDATVIKHSWDEPERFAAIFDRYFGEVHRYLARRVGVKSADDLAGDVFLAAFAQRRRYDVSHDCARPWPYGIATNLVGSHRRAERRFFHALARAGAQDVWHGAENVWHGEEDRTAERVSALAVRPALTTALAALAPGDRDVLLLVALAGLGYQEVAEALGIPYGTVCSRLNRARKRMRESLGGLNPSSGALESPCA